MSGDVQPRKRKDKKRRKDDEPVPVQTHTPIYTSNLVNDDVNIHVHKESGTGGGICAKLVFFVLLSALAVLIGLIITEHRGLTDLETADSESKFSQIFEGWIDSSSNSHDDHDLEDALDADHDDDHDDDHEEVDLSEGEEDHQASEEDEEHEHSDENEEHQPSEEDDEQERSEEENEEGENESAEEYIEDNGDEDEETDMDEEKYSEEENEVVQDNNSDEEVADDRDNEDEGEYAEDQDEVKASDEEEQEGGENDDEEEQKQDEKDDDEVDDEEVDEEETFESKEEEDASTKKATSSLEKDTLRKGEEKLSDKKFSKRSSEVESNPADDPDETSNVPEDAASTEETSTPTPDLSRRNTIIVPPTYQEVEQDIEHDDEGKALETLSKVFHGEKNTDTNMFKNFVQIQTLRYFLVVFCTNGQYSNAIMVHKLVIDRFPNTPKYMNDMAITYLTINRIDDARSVLKQVLAKWPDDGVALVHYGFILKTADNKLNSAVKYLKRGILTREKGVLDGRFFFHLGDALTRLGKTEEAMKVYEEGTKHKLFLSKYQRSLYNVPRLTGKPWWQSKDLPYLPSFELLKKNWRKIREEALSVLNVKGYFQDESENLKDTGDWKQFELYARGKKNSRNCGRCPFTCSILDQIPEAAGCKRGQTKFSVMHPGTHIWPHCGPTNCRLRTHLGLKVPPGTYIRVASETRSWKEGEILVFDDSYEHEVWHNGTEFRLVLIVDVWHPELTPSEKKNLSPI
nr:aspartyl/asparaginyl beta-hydroxylase [Leptinotarsa decemlineata]